MSVDLDKPIRADSYAVVLEQLRENIKFALQGDKGYITNGNFELVREDPDVTGIPDGRYVCDLFKYSQSGSMVFDSLYDESNVPDISIVNTRVPGSMKFTCTTADASLSATDYNAFSYFIPGSEFSDIHEQTVTLRFFVRSNKAGKYCVTLRNHDNTRSYVTEYTSNGSGDFEEFKLTIDLDTAGSWLFSDSDLGVSVAFTLSSGLPTATADTWSAGNFISTPGMVNLSDTVGNYWQVACIGLYKGDDAPPVKVRERCDVEHDANRFLAMTYNNGTYPGVLSSGGQQSIQVGQPTSAGLRLQTTWCYPRKMIGVPSMTIYASLIANDSGFVNINGVAETANLVQLGEKSTAVYGVKAAGGGISINFHAVADARF